MPKINAVIVPEGLVAPSCHDRADDVLLFSVENSKSFEIVEIFQVVIYNKFASGDNRKY